MPDVMYGVIFHINNSDLIRASYRFIVKETEDDKLQKPLLKLGANAPLDFLYISCRHRSELQNVLQTQYLILHFQFHFSLELK